MIDVNTRSAFLVPSEIFETEPQPLKDEYARRCFRVLRMAAILHGKGFHGLRVFPYEYPLAYRVELYPAEFAGRDGVKYDFSLHGQRLEREKLIARYSGSMGANYFDWDDVAHLNAHQLALVFIKRFPELARATYCLDYAYVGWFATLLAHCEYGRLPYRFGEYEDDMNVMRIRQYEPKTGTHRMDWFPLPPTPSGGMRLDPRPLPAWMEQE